MGEDRQVTLMELLDSREARAEHQRVLLAEFSEENCVLISVTLNIPGPVKDKPAYRRVMQTGIEQLMTKLSGKNAGFEIFYKEVRELVTGPEGYLVVTLSGNKDALDVKRLTIELEEASPLGRLFDMDVIDKTGACVSRKDLGAGRRKCLLCSEDAKICARSQRHKLSELLAEIDRIIEAGLQPYF